MSIDGLKKASPILHAAERIFYAAQFCFPGVWIFGTRAESQVRIAAEAQPETAVIARARKVDAYVLGWLAIEIACGFVLPHVSAPWQWAIVATMIWRVAELIQIHINLNVFDRLRIPGRTHYVSSIARNVLLSVWSFFETALLFGVIYSAAVVPLSRKDDWADPYYFSIVTQLTIGYGDISPVRWTRAIASMQALTGFLLAVFAISRLIAFLPRTESFFGDG